jgi:hypothetical protein
MLLRAADQEGLAENVGLASVAPSPSLHASPAYHTQYRTTPCVNTSGQTFAIWLNVVYLTPLTFLFVRFFIKSYIRRTSKPTGRGTRHAQAEKTGADALKAVHRELHVNENTGNGVLRETANGHLTSNGYVKENGKINGHASGLEKTNGTLKNTPRN